jgi:hypothetical protein
MKIVHKWAAPVLCTAMLILLASCGGTTTYYIPTDSTAGNMSVKQARNWLATVLKEGGILTSGRKVPITDVRVNSYALTVTDENGEQSIFVYRELPQIAIGLGGLDVGWVLMLEGQHTFSFGHLPSKDRDILPNALHVLKQNAIKQKADADEYGLGFAASLADYRKKAAANAALPEEANKYKVQAEGAVRDKAFVDAADLYAAALNIAPWWPVGHFNRALVLGEGGDYEMATREMNYYLQLVPHAPNARAAQNKIYEWARLDSK